VPAEVENPIDSDLKASFKNAMLDVQSVIQGMGFDDCDGAGG
jgi:hypothetical protein